MRTRTLAAICAAVALPAWAGTAEVPPTLDRVGRSGTIVLGVREASYPLSYLDGDNGPVGYHVDICHRIVESVKAQLHMPGLRVEYRTVTSQNRIPLLADGTIDLECGSTTNTEVRQAQVAFAPTTYLATVRMAVKKRSGVRDLPDLDGRVVVTTAGSTGIDLLRGHETGRKLAITAVYGKDHTDSFVMLENDQASAFIMDDNLLAGLIMMSRSPDGYQLAGRPLDLQPIAIMLRKGDPAFKAVVDDSVAGLMKSGEIGTLYHRWFESPIPPRGVNLNFAMSDTLKVLLTYPDSAPAEAYRPRE